MKFHFGSDHLIKSKPERTHFKPTCIKDADTVIGWGSKYQETYPIASLTVEGETGLRPATLEDIIKAHPNFVDEYEERTGMPLTPLTDEEKILAPYKYEIEETYREQGEKAGKALVASILRQEGFEPTSIEEQEAVRQSVQNEMTGGTSSNAEYEEMAAAMEADKQDAIQSDLTAMKASPETDTQVDFKVGDMVEFSSKSNTYKGKIAYIDSDGEARIVCYGNNYYASVSDLKKV